MSIMWKRHMTWYWKNNNRVPGWQCKSNKHGGNDKKKKRNKYTQREPALKGSKFFNSDEFHPYPRNIGKWLSTIYHFRKAYTQKSIINDLHISKKLYKQFETSIYSVIKHVRTNETVSLGGESPVEFDGLYYKLKKQRIKGNKSRYHKKKCVFTLINRYFNKYGRHNRLSFIVDEESTKCCKHLIIKHVPKGLCAPCVHFVCTLCATCVHFVCAEKLHIYLFSNKRRKYFDGRRMWFR